MFPDFVLGVSCVLKCVEEFGKIIILGPRRLLGINALDSY
jgi:hypothetical protein